MGHLGKDRTLQLIRDRFYCPRMEDDITHFVTKICSCVKRKKPHIVPVASMHTFSSAAPLELIGLDFLHLDTCSGGYQYLLVLTDHFSKFVQVYPTTNKSAKTAAGWLYNDFMLRYGLPGKILQGREFETREENLRTIYFPDYRSIAVSNDSEPPLTTYRPMAKLSA